MKKTVKARAYAWVPFALLALFYLGGLWQRPMFDLEYPFALWMKSHSPAPGFLNRTAAMIRLGSALATLMTAGTIFLFLRRRDRQTGGLAAAVYLSSGIVYAAGTAADHAAYFTLGFTVAVCALADLVLRKKAIHFFGLAAGAALAAYAMTQMPPTAFRWTYWPWYLVGFFPYLLILPVLIAGGRKIGFRAAVPRTAAVGGILGFAALAVGEWTAGMPFLALLIALALRGYAELEPDLARLDRLIRHWVRVFAVCGILLAAGHALVRFGKVRPFPLPNNLIMTLFAILILVVWFAMAAKEKRFAAKVCFFALGAAFLLCGVPAMLSAATVARHAPAEMLRRCWPQGADGIGMTVATTPELLPALRYADVTKIVYEKNTETMPPLIRPGARTILLVRESDSRKLPAARRKIVLRAAGLAIMEYE